jgi:MYXO-CTERM domain-containing protein
MRLAIATTIALLMLTPMVAADVDFDSKLLEPGETWEYTVTEADPGGQWYHCTIHPNMEAMIHVFEEGYLGRENGSTETHMVSIDDDGTAEGGNYSVMHLTVEVGDTIIWTNNGELPHTVTSTTDAEYAGEESESDDHDDDGHNHEHGGDSNSTPGIGAPLLVAALGVAALARRRA